ncbi:MAG: DMT family transporter [Halanaerobiales bacterium]|nr:DMT family transporter [Halanaerobiales bacterium]
MDKLKFNIFTNKYTVVILSILACILWGSAFPSLKVSYSILEIENSGAFIKMLFASYRFMLASFMLFIFIILKSGIKRLKLKRNDYFHLLTLGLIQTFAQYAFFYNGLAKTTGVKASILVTSGIFFTVIASHFIYHDDKLNKVKLFGLLLGITGVIIININRGNLNFIFNLTGEGFIIMTGVMSTIAILYVKYLSKNMDIMIITAYQMFFGSVTLFLIAISRSSIETINFNLKSGFLLIYLAFISAAAFGLWYSLIKFNKVGYITIYKFIVPVSGVFLSAIFIITESVSINAVLALALVSLGIVIINMPEGYLTKKMGG